MSDKQAILLGQGLAHLEFGIDRKTVRERLGPPDSKTQMDYLHDGSEVEEIWHFETGTLEAAFKQEDSFRLWSLRISSEAYTLEEEVLVGMKKKAVLELSRRCRWGESDEVDLGWEWEMMTFDLVSLILVFDPRELVDSVEWFPFWLDENTPRWP